MRSYVITFSFSAVGEKMRVVLCGEYTIGEFPLEEKKKRRFSETQVPRVPTWMSGSGDDAERVNQQETFALLKTP